MLLHTAHRSFYTEAFTHNSFYTQKLSTHNTQKLFTQIRLHTEEIAVLPQFWAIEPHFVRKGCAGQLEIAILPQFFAIEPHFVRKRCDGNPEIAILPQFLTIEPHFVRKGFAGQLEIAILPQFLAIEPHFVRNSCAGRLANRNFTSVFGDRTSFPAKGLRFVPSRWHCPCPRLQERNRKEGEGKRARGQRGQEDKM